MQNNNHYTVHVNNTVHKNKILLPKVNIFIGKASLKWKYLKLEFPPVFLVSIS